MYDASALVDIMRDCADKTIGDGKSSRIVFGTVATINPLSVLLEGHEKPLHESFFYLSRNVKVCEESLRVRSISGNFNGLDIKITAATIAKTLLGQSITNSAGALEGSWAADAADPPGQIGVAGETYSRNEALEKGSQGSAASQAEASVNLQDGKLEVEIDETPFGDETHRDHRRHKRAETNETWEGGLKTGIAWAGKDEMDSAFYDQTFTIDVIRNRGLKVGDHVLCTSHNNQQLYVIWEVLNRIL